MPRIPRVIASAASLGRRAQAVDLGFDQGAQAQARAIDEVGEAANALFEADEDALVSKGIQGASTELNDLRIAVGENPDIDAREGQFADGQREILSRHRETISTVRFQNSFDDRMFAISERTRLGVKEGVTRSRLDQISANTLTSVAGLTTLAGEADSDDLRQEYLTQIDTALGGAVSSGALTATDRAQAEIRRDAELAAAQEVRDSQAVADDLEAQFPGDLAAQTKAARSQFSGSMEDLVVARLKDRNGIAVTAQRQARQAKFESVVNLALGGDYTRVEALKADLDVGQLSTVLGILDDKDRGKGPQADSEEYWDFYNGLSNQATAEEFRQKDLNLLAGKITPKQMSQLRDLQLEVDLLDVFPKKVDEALSIIKLDPSSTKKSKYKREQRQLFRRNVQAAKELAVQQKG